MVVTGAAATGHCSAVFACRIYCHGDAGGGGDGVLESYCISAIIYHKYVILHSLVRLISLLSNMISSDLDFIGGRPKNKKHAKLDQLG